MVQLDPLGVTAFVFGIALFALAFVVMRVIPRLRTAAPSPPPIPPGLSDNPDAVLLIQSGGRVVYINQEARDWFGLLEEEPNLERLARRTRPGEVFLGLCSTEGRARFSLNGRFIEGSSYFIPYANSSAVLVSLHRPHVTGLASGEMQVSDHTLNIFSELSQAMATSLDLETTLLAVLESVERLIPSDFPEITVWDADNQYLIPYHFIGLPGLDHRLEKSAQRLSPDEGYSGYLVRKREALLIEEVDAFRETRPVIDRKHYPFNSYLGVPLLVANELVGTLELASLSKGSFNQNDLEILRILSGQAAVAVHNALLYQEEQRRIVELSGLSQLARAAGSLQDPTDLYTRLVESIKPLLEVELIGFWIYDENQHSLEAQIPFIGLPPQFTSLYHISIQPGSQAEEILLSQETIIASDAPDDPRLEALELAYRAQASGIKHTVLAPLLSGTRMMGYLQVADKLDGEPFDQDDLRILSIIAAQAAIIIENATLIQQAQRRALRAEALRRIASLSGSAATLDEILQYSLRELAHLLQAEMAAIFLLDENQGKLCLHEESLFGVPDEITNRIGKLAVDLSLSMFTPTGNGAQRSVIVGDAFEEIDSLLIYRPFIESMQVRAIINVPLVIRDRMIGEVMLGNRTPSFYDHNDMILIATAAGQLAGSIEQSTLSQQTDENLMARVDQLTSLTRVFRELNTSIDLEHLVIRVYEESLHATRAACGSVLLFTLNHPAGTPLITHQAGDQRENSLSLLELGVLQQEEPLIVEDFDLVEHEDGPSHFKPPHAGIRSALLVPIAYKEQVIGLIHLHSKTPGRFDADSLETAQTLAIQAAISIGNVQRYQEQLQRSGLLTRRVETLARVFETTQALKLDQPLEKSLEAMAYGIREVTTFDIVLVSIYDPESGNLQHVIGTGRPPNEVGAAYLHSQPWEFVQELLQPEYCFGRAYFIPCDKTPLTPPDVHLHYSYPITAGLQQKGDAHWDAEDLLLLPIISSYGAPLGLISVDRPRDGLRPDQPTIEALEIFATQASITLEGYDKLREYRARAHAMERELDRAREAVNTTQQNLPSLLKKDFEQTVAIQRLSQRAKRIRAGLDIAEIVNRQSEQGQVMQALGKEILTRMDLDLALVAEPGPEGPRLSHILGPTPAGVNPGALFGQRNPLRQCLQTGENTLIHNIDEVPKWSDSPLLQAMESKAFICIAIPAESSRTDMHDGSDRAEVDKEHGRTGKEPVNVEAALLAISHTPLTPFTAEDEHLFALLARQVAIALQNQRLLSETNRRLREVNLLLDFSRQLGSLDPIEILYTLSESVLRIIPACDACMIALWDQERACLAPQVARGYHDDQIILEICYREGEALPGQVFQTGRALRIDQVDFARHYNLPPEDLLRYRDAARGRLPVSNLIVPIGGALHPVSDSAGAVTAAEAGSKSASPLGVLLLDSFQSPSAFTREDEALITSLAQQTALTLENARLFQASEQRAVQLQTLTNVASTITSSLQTDELIASLLDQVKVILPYDTGTLWLRHENDLTIRAARGFEDAEERVGLSVEAADSLLLEEMIKTGKPIYVEDVSQDARFPSLVEHRYFSWLGVPLISKGEVVGVIALEKGEARYYNAEQIQAATTFAGQAAVSLENANLYEDSLRRAHELDQRSRRLALLNRLSTELNSSMDPELILKLTLQELLLAINCTAASALLFDKDGRAFVRAETPDASSSLPLQLPHAALFEYLRESLGVLNLEDALDREGLPSSPMLAPLGEYLASRSAKALLILPLSTGSELHGLILGYKDHAYRFTADEVELARTISNQAAVAVQNARLLAETQHLYGETQQHSSELAFLFDLGVNLSQILDPQQLIDIIFEKLAALLSIDSIGLVLQSESGEMNAQMIDHGDKVGPIPMERTGISLSEYVLSTGLPQVFGDIQRDRESLPVPGVTIGAPVRSWLGIPLVVRNATIGVLSVQSDLPDKFGEEQARLVGQVGNQLAVALDNARLFSTVQNYAADLEKRVAERTAQLAREHERTETLLGIITELSTSLDMDIVLTRTLAVINETVKAEHSLIMLLLPEEQNLYLRASIGYATPTPKGGKVSSFKRNEGLAGWVIGQRQAVLIPDLLEDDRWEQHEDQTKQHRSAMGVPLLMGEDILGALLLFHRQTDQFTPDQLDLVQTTAKQIAVAINNAQLFNLIRDQAERLGDMLRQQHIETSRSQAILEAVADGVLVTDAKRGITLFNASAEQILGLSRNQVLGRSLEHFTGLFGKAAHTWVEKIKTWSEDPSSYRTGDIYAEQIELEDTRVVSVHLSPVRLRNDFLGTVSTFRDISHQVEVDRLKSEFVATVSHELRTPMTSIKGYVEVLLMGAAGNLTEQQVHFLDIVKANTERLAILVNDLLDVSRIEAGRVELTIQPLDLPKLGQNAVSDLVRRTKEEHKPMQVRLEAPSELPRANGDPDRVRQILDNLLENAYYYTPENGQITLRMYKDGDEVQIDVKDNGIGILPKDQSRVFERFFRGEDPLVLATSGTGLGLSIVQRLIEMHKGRIWFTSTGLPGEGSTFSFTLPVYNPGEH